MFAKLNVVLLNWNSVDQTERCLAAVMRSDGVEPDVLVVDNGSAGDDAERLRVLLGAERLLALPENRGYAGGMNAGLAFWRSRPGAAPVLIITPDATVEADTLRLLVEELEATPEAGVVGPLVVYSRRTGRIGAGGRIEPSRVRAQLLARPAQDSPYDADWVDGCCMLVRRAALDAVSAGFDERYFAYYEETDLCEQLRSAGWHIRVVPAAEIDHPKTEGTLPPHYFYYMVRNCYLFWQKNHGVGTARVAAKVLRDTAQSWGSVLRALLLPDRRAELKPRLRDARLQLRAAGVGTLDHLRRRYGEMPASRMPGAGG